MQPAEILIIFFLLPAAVMLLSFCCVTPLCNITLFNNRLVASRSIAGYSRFIAQLQVARLSSVNKHTIAFILIIQIIPITIHAQTDTNYVDTISMKNIDTSGVNSADTVAASDESTTYDDQDDGYVDTTQKHIYDTSQYFFTWKEYYSDSFTKRKFGQRHLIEADVAALKKEDDFWYIPAIEKMENRIKTDPKYRDSLLNARNKELQDEREQSFLYQPWFNTLLWIIIIGVFAAAVIYFLVQNKIGVFSKEAASAEDENAEEPDDIFHLSYTKLIQQAEKDKNYRTAIRLLFLQTLKSLSDVNAIQYQPDYTNLHYLQQLNQSKYYNEFFKVMRSYEYAWYGKFEISATQYTSIKNDFSKLQYKIT